MAGRNNSISNWLLPLSILYGWGIKFRNHLFKKQVLRTHTFNLPVICVGNLTVGGTGKTPHTEYLIRLLQKDFHVGVLSRGYKRKSKGFVLAKQNTDFTEIGDEPYQMKQKFKNVTLAVCKKREEGILQMRSLKKERRPDVIILDDAYQYRYVQAGINILLTDSNRLICDDKLLPAGRLREPFEGRARANIIIVTKCQTKMKPIDYSLITKKLQLFPFQQIFFTTQEYLNLTKVFGHNSLPKENLKKASKILLLTGIATPLIMQQAIMSINPNVTLLSFGDHHNFSQADEEHINELYDKLHDDKSLIVTSEKDAARLRFSKHLGKNVKNDLYALPIEIKFLRNESEKFNHIITDYVRKNQTNNGVASN
jgi:tetraacyldisaccharide 4'-kinase